MARIKTNLRHKRFADGDVVRLSKKLLREHQTRNLPDNPHPWFHASARESIDTRPLEGEVDAVHAALRGEEVMAIGLPPKAKRSGSS